jgi:hypothetical protein
VTAGGAVYQFGDAHIEAPYFGNRQAGSPIAGIG